jgi:hypothetical protein
MERFTLASTAGSAAVGVLAQSASSCAPQLLTIQAWASEHGLSRAVRRCSTSARR